MPTNDLFRIKCQSVAHDLSSVIKRDHDQVSKGKGVNILIQVEKKALDIGINHDKLYSFWIGKGEMICYSKTFSVFLGQINGLTEGWTYEDVSYNEKEVESLIPTLPLTEFTNGSLWINVVPS